MIKDKIKQLQELRNMIDASRRKGEKIVFTNGCFDILHLGHMQCLEQASLLGDVLIVAVNSDSSVRKIKGKLRPIMPEQERASLIAACECVDYVTIFLEETPIELIKTLKPDILVKGSDWSSAEIAGRDFVESYGGKVVIIDFIEGYSSSAIIAKIKSLSEK